LRAAIVLLRHLLRQRLRKPVELTREVG
jgi:hypothetical protein